jgi:hypothetical protein
MPWHFFEIFIVSLSNKGFILPMNSYSRSHLRHKVEKPKFYINNSFEPIDEVEFQKIRNAQKVPAKSQNSINE